MLLVDVQVLVRLIDDGLCDAARAALLLVVVECGVDPTLLACPHVRSAVLASVSTADVLLLRLRHHDILAHLNRIESAVLWSTTHHLCKIERLGHVRRLVGRRYLADSVDGLRAAEQLRAWERELLVRAE